MYSCQCVGGEGGPGAGADGRTLSNTLSVEYASLSANDLENASLSANETKNRMSCIFTNDINKKKVNDISQLERERERYIH